MNATLVERFLEQDILHYAQLLGVRLDDFRAEPSVLAVGPPQESAVEIVRFRERCAVVTAPEWKERMTRLLQEASWKEWLDSPDGLARLLAALGLEAMDTTAERPGGPVHNIALLCDPAKFRPYKEHTERIIRITPDHPLWAHPEDAPEWPFKYVIIEGGQTIAQAIMRHNLEVLDGRTWALGVYVRPEHRRKGYGKAVVSSATGEVVEGGGLALWNAQGHNLASLALCQALGYEKFFWQLRVPRA